MEGQVTYLHKISLLRIFRNSLKIYELENGMKSAGGPETVLMIARWCAPLGLLPGRSGRFAATPR